MCPEVFACVFHFVFILWRARVGYAIWYAALRHLTSTRAALVQLSVPVLAAAGGVTLLAEAITPRLAIAGAVILGSIAVGVLGRARA